MDFSLLKNRPSGCGPSHFPKVAMLQLCCDDPAKWILDNERIISRTLFYWIDKKMFSFNFIQILGLLLFFFGLIVLNRCNQVEHMDYLTRSLSETMHSAKSDLEERETTRQLVRKSLLYSSMGIFVSLGGMAMFFVSAS